MITNEEAMRRMEKEKEIVNPIKIRKLKSLGSLMRRERYELQTIIEV